MTVVVFCPTCEQDTIPLRDGSCGWCDRQLVGVPAADDGHGSRASYLRGCKCVRCKRAAAVYAQELRRRRKVVA